MFAQPEQRYGVIISCIAHQMKPTNPFNGHNTARFQARYCRLQRLFFLRPLTRAKPFEVGTACRTGNGLGMEATVVWITILFIALRTEWE